MRIPLPQRHWTLTYVWDRLNLAAYEHSHPDAPWLTATMTAFLEGWIKPTDVIVEFGSGRSTTWFGKRGGEVVSVEHDCGWFSIVEKRIGEQNLTNVTYLLVENADEYARAADARVERADLILVDGINRDQCALWALEKVRPGGIIVVDNANWYLPHTTRSPASVGEHGVPASKDWQCFYNTVSNWRYSWTTNGVTDTAAFFAPV